MPQSPEEIKEKEEARAWSAVAEVPTQEATPTAPTSGQVSDTKTSPEADEAPPTPELPKNEIVEQPTPEEAESPKVRTLPQSTLGRG